MLQRVATLTLASLALLSAGVRVDEGMLGEEAVHSKADATVETQQGVAVGGAVVKAATELEHFIHLLSSTESGLESDWFWRSGCRFRFRDRPTKVFYFQISSGLSSHTVKLIRHAADPTLEVWEDHEWHVVLEEGQPDGVRFTAVPKDGVEATNATVVHLFESTSIEYATRIFDALLFIKGSDLEFVDGLYLEPHIVRLGLEDGSNDLDTASANRVLGMTLSYSETRLANYTITGARLGLQVGQIVAPIAGVSAVFAMTTVGLGIAILGTLLGVVSSILTGYALGGVVAGFAGLGQALGLVRKREISERIGAEAKMWQELRCMKGFKECPLLPTEDPMSGESPHLVIAPKEQECPTTTTTSTEPPAEPSAE